ncbi:MAG: bifunctional diguanylate cyclase/phosphodiesterase [Candidatus Schekmanbacteria bacterium]|nr:bifunctional diguanylate cyclase/phosphodiesterase [Candidatus Schekmanbacteria bacterium]
MDMEQTLVAAVLNGLDEPAVLLGSDGRIVLGNESFAATVGRHRGELSGQRWEAFIAAIDGDAQASDVVTRSSASGSWRGSMRLRTAMQGTVETSAHIVRVNEASEQCFLATWRPSSGAQPAGGERETDEIAAPNRLLFFDRLEHALAAAERERRSLLLLVVGLDGFTHLNDWLGYEAGDDILARVSARLMDAIRRADSCTRVGGDQFGLVMQLAEGGDATTVMEKVMASMHEPLAVAGEEVRLTATVGASLYPHDGSDARLLFQKASSAMVHAKREGRDRCVFFSAELNARARARIDLENRLRGAVTREEFVLHYQPKIHIDTDMIAGAEALLRWRDPEGALIPPSAFVPIAEQCGLIHSLGTWALRTACRQAVEWQAQGLPGIRVAVNVSAKQFLAPDFVELVARALAESGLAPHWLELEITESVFMGAVERTIERLSSLRSLGVFLSIDDFGTGYSSLSYLSRFPITTLKIDRSFVQDLETNRTTAEIARAIIALSVGLELEVIAEGAETAGHVAFLRTHGCHLVQGFYYSRPLAPEHFAELLRLGKLGGRDVPQDVPGPDTI